MGGNLDGLLQGGTPISLTRPLPANPRETITGPQNVQPQDTGTVVPNIISGVLEQAGKAPPPTGGTTGQTPRPQREVLPANTLTTRGQTGQNDPRRPLAFSLPEGSALTGPNGDNNLLPLGGLLGLGKGAK